MRTYDPLKSYYINGQKKFGKFCWTEKIDGVSKVGMKMVNYLNYIIIKKVKSTVFKNHILKMEN